MTPCAGRGMLLLCVPTLTIHAVYAIELEPSLVDVVRQRANHPAIFPLEKPPHRGREDQEPRAGVTEDEQLHVAAKRRAEPAAMFAKQREKGLRTRDPGLQTVS